MAWYEESGPGAHYVRTHARTTFEKWLAETRQASDGSRKTPRAHQIMLDSCLDEILKRRINGEAGDFGSFRGFATSGLSDELKILIKQDISNTFKEIITVFWKQMDLNQEISDFGLMPPPKEKSATSDGVGLLMNRGGGTYLEAASKWTDKKEV